jgi:hypothetical protein
LMFPFFLFSCTKFSVNNGHGIIVEQWGAPLVSRQDKFTVTHQWVDNETNTLHEIRIERNTDENADGQVRLIEKAFELGLKAGLKAGGTP